MTENNIKPDHITKVYMDKPEIFADIVNYSVYGGRKIVDPKTLNDAPTVATAFVYNGDDVSISFEKIRDNRKVVKLNPVDNTAYMIYGAENQTHIHYAMPVRNMLYDAIEYSNQITLRRKSFRKDSKDRKNKITVEEAPPETDEFLSSWKAEDKLVPAVTIVINFSDKKWDAPLSLHEMFDYDSENRNEAIKKYIPDYRILLVDPHQMDDDDFERMNTELGSVLKIISAAKSKQKLMKAIGDVEHLNRDAVEVINACTGLKIKTSEKNEVINVSDGVRELISESEARGEAIGEARGEAKKEAAIKAMNIAMVKAMKEQGYSQEQIDRLVNAVNCGGS